MQKHSKVTIIQKRNRIPEMHKYWRRHVRSLILLGGICTILCAIAEIFMSNMLMKETEPLSFDFDYEE